MSQDPLPNSPTSFFNAFLIGKGKRTELGHENSNFGLYIYEWNIQTVVLLWLNYRSVGGNNEV